MVGDGTIRIFLASRLALLWGTRDYPELSSGVTSGPGNQGTQNTAHMMGEAGTGLAQISVPRSLKFGSGGTAQGSSK